MGSIFPTVTLLAKMCLSAVGSRWVAFIKKSLIFLVSMIYSFWWHEKISERKFCRGNLFYLWAKSLFEEVVWEIHLNTSSCALCLSWVKNTPGCFHKEWIDEENKAVFILIRHWKSFRRLSSVGKDVCHLNWLGIRLGFFVRNTFGPGRIFCRFLCMSGTDLSV